MSPYFDDVLFESKKSNICVPSCESEKLLKKRIYHREKGGQASIILSSWGETLSHNSIIATKTLKGELRLKERQNTPLGAMFNFAINICNYLCSH